MVFLYIVVQLRTQLHIVTYTLTALCAPTEYVLVILGTKVLSSMYTHSVQFKQKLAQTIGSQDKIEKKVNTMVLMSIAPIKCGVGSLYFMEKRAKCTLVDWLFQGTTFLMISLKN